MLKGSTKIIVAMLIMTEFWEITRNLDDCGGFMSFFLPGVNAADFFFVEYTHGDSRGKYAVTREGLYSYVNLNGRHELRNKLRDLEDIEVQALNRVEPIPNIISVRTPTPQGILLETQKKLSEDVHSTQSERIETVADSGIRTTITNSTTRSVCNKTDIKFSVVKMAVVILLNSQMRNGIMLLVTVVIFALGFGPKGDVYIKERVVLSLVVAVLLTFLLEKSISVMQELNRGHHSRLQNRVAGRFFRKTGLSTPSVSRASTRTK